MKNVTLEQEKQPTCQNCRHQSNKPSYCSKLEVYVGRKAQICLMFSAKKGGK